MTTPNLRRAALTLYRLNAEDRRWILNELEPSERAVLESLVNELQLLGFQPESLQPISTQEGLSASPLTDFNDIDISSVIDALNGESPVVQGLIIAARPSAEHEQLFASIPLADRETVQRLAISYNASKSLSLETVVRAIRSHVSQDDSQFADSGPRAGIRQTPGSNLFKWFRLRHGGAS